MAGRSDRLRERVLAPIARIRRGPCTICDAGLPRALTLSGFLHAVGDKDQRSSPASPFLRASLRQAASFGLF